MVTPDPAHSPSSDPGYFYLRHAWPIRILHWVNLLTLTVLLMSGLQIFNAHCALYWGKSSYSGDPPLMRMYAQTTANGDPQGVTELFGYRFSTTGVFGLSKSPNGGLAQRGFPSWITLPGAQWLALARRWHFFFAWLFVINGALYAAYVWRTGHLARDLVPTRRDWRSVGRSILDHLRFRHPTGEAARRYNVLQKFAYLTVMFIVLPFVVLMGLAMSPAMNSLWPGWVDLFGGRQSARTLHFLGATAIVLFVFIHVFEVVITGLWNNLRSMLTGRYRIVEPVAAVSRGPQEMPNPGAGP